MLTQKWRTKWKENQGIWALCGKNVDGRNQHHQQWHSTYVFMKIPSLNLNHISGYLDQHFSWISTVFSGVSISEVI